MNKNNSKNKNFEFGQVMSLLESMDDGIKVISEQHGTLVGRLDGMDGILNKIDGRLDGIDGRLDGIDGRLNSLDEKFDRMQEDITDIKYKLSEKVDRDEFEKMEKRVVRLENLVLAKVA